MAPRDEEAVDKIFSGCLENLPPLSSKVFDQNHNGLIIPGVPEKMFLSKQYSLHTKEHFFWDTL